MQLPCCFSQIKYCNGKAGHKIVKYFVIPQDVLRVDH